MELNDYLRILRQRGWLIVVLGILTAGAAFGFSETLVEEEYKSSVQLLITSRPDFGQTQATQALVRDFSAWLKSSKRAADVIDTLNLDMEPLALLGKVTVAPRTDSNIIQLEVRHSDGNIANDIARVWGEQLIQRRVEENARLRQEDRIEAELLDDPQFSLDRPRTRVNTVAGGVLGLLIGVLLVLVLEWLESGVVRRADDIDRYLDLPVIGTIPK